MALDEASRREKLGSLRARIIEEVYVQGWQDVWFFVEDKELGVKGWQGTQDIMFVGTNPSTGRGSEKLLKNLRSDPLFGVYYPQLQKNGFENAHLTDLIKIRATNEEKARLLGNDAVTKQHVGYLLEEIEIVEPRLIVALGWECLGLVKDCLAPEVRARLRRIRHYSPLYRKKDDAEKFAEEMRGVRAEYDSLPRVPQARTR